MRFKDVLQMKPSTLKRFARLDRFDEHLELHRLDCMSSHRMLNNYDFVQKFVRDTPAEQIRPVRLLTGDDLVAMGLQPGPSFRQLLDSLEEAQLNDLIHTREEAVEFLKSLPVKNRAS
jgi:poly(A) polymerase